MQPTLFADTFYWVAILSPRDPFHVRVMSWGNVVGTTRLLTTDEVLTDVLNWFSGAGPYWRGKAASFVHDLRTDPDVEVLPIPGPISTPHLPYSRLGLTRVTA